MQYKQNIPSVPQGYLLDSTSTVTLYSSSAGGGKTQAILLAALKFMQYPNAVGGIFRSDSKSIVCVGSIWHEAVSMYRGIYPDLIVSQRNLEITFPNGALLKFSHLQDYSDLLNHSTIEYSFVAFDQASDFDESTVISMFKCMRNTRVPHTPQMFLCTTPSYTSFLRGWIKDFYLDDEGIPKDSTQNVERYFGVQGSNIQWYNDLHEAKATHGDGVMSFRLIKALSTDNEALLKDNPHYIDMLKSLGKSNKNKLLYGSWDQ